MMMTTPTCTNAQHVLPGQPSQVLYWACYINCSDLPLGLNHIDALLGPTCSDFARSYCHCSPYVLIYVMARII